MKKKILLIFSLCVVQNMCASMVRFDELKKVALGYAQSAADSAHDVWAAHPTACKAVLAGTVLTAVGTYCMWPKAQAEKPDACVADRLEDQHGVVWADWDKRIQSLPVAEGRVLEKTILVYLVFLCMKQLGLQASTCRKLFYDKSTNTVVWSGNTDSKKNWFREVLLLEKGETADFCELVTLICVRSGGTRAEEQSLFRALGLDVSLSRNVLNLKFLAQKMESLSSSADQ